MNFEDAPEKNKIISNKVTAYHEQSNNYLLVKLSEARAERDTIKNEFIKADTARACWKIVALIMAAITIGKWLGAAL